MCQGVIVTSKCIKSVPPRGGRRNVKHFNQWGQFGCKLCCCGQRYFSGLSSTNLYLTPSSFLYVVEPSTSRILAIALPSVVCITRSSRSKDDQPSFIRMTSHFVPDFKWTRYVLHCVPSLSNAAPIVLLTQLTLGRNCWIICSVLSIISIITQLFGRKLQTALARRRNGRSDYRWSVSTHRPLAYKQYCRCRPPQCAREGRHCCCCR